MPNSLSGVSIVLFTRTVIAAVFYVVVAVADDDDGRDDDARDTSPPRCQNKIFRSQSLDGHVINLKSTASVSLFHLHVAKPD